MRSVDIRCLLCEKDKVSSTIKTIKVNSHSMQVCEDCKAAFSRSQLFKELVKKYPQIRKTKHGNNSSPNFSKKPTSRSPH